MKLTQEILVKLGFEENDKTWTKWKLELREDATNYFLFDMGRIYFEVETVEDLSIIWKATKCENKMKLPLNSL